MVFVGEARGGGELLDLLISDERDSSNKTLYISESGALTEVDGVPAITMFDGRIQQMDEKGRLSDLSFDQYPFELSSFMLDENVFVLKASDRFLPELFQPDLTSYYDAANLEKFLAEGHMRLASPLLNLTMGLLGVVAVLGGAFSRRGYQRRIATCSTIALLLQLLTLASVSAGEDDVGLNVIQYAIPISSLLIMAYIFFRAHRVKGTNCSSH